MTGSVIVVVGFFILVAFIYQTTLIYKLKKRNQTETKKEELK